MNASTFVSLVITLIFVVVVLSAILSFPLMLLWNGCLVGAIDGVHEVTWLQMWGIAVLFSSLFKATTVSAK